MGFASFLVVVASLAACETPAVDEKAPAAGKGPESAATPATIREPAPEAPFEMVQMLGAIAEQSQQLENPYASRIRLEYLRNLPRPDEPRALLQRHFEIALASLHAGETELAIREIEELLASTHEGPRLNTHYLRELLAISHLRLGEQENCLEDHSADSCILPFRAGAIHRRQRGSRAAIAVYRDLLETWPDDLRSRWLLNVAYMTVGEYPEGVPARWRLPPEALASDYPLPRFPNIAPLLGLDVEGLSGGSIMDDFDGDGYLDIWASSFGAGDQLRYFHNDADGSFTDRTKDAGLDGLFGGLNLVHADYDNDGHRDVFVLRGAWLRENGNQPNSLLRNGGDGTFRDVTRETGLLSFHPTQTAAWGDYNSDGWLDLLVGNETSPEVVHPCELYASNGDGTFREVGGEVGLAVQAQVKGVVWGDYDNDGRPDLYVSSLGGPNYLFRNEGPDSAGRWRFTDVARAAGVAEPKESFPTWFWDYDNDGWLDLLVLGYSGSRPGLVAADVMAAYLGLRFEAATVKLYRNEGTGIFRDVTADTGITWPFYAMGSNFGDLDNDGWLDFYVGTGEPDLRSIVPNKMFRNDGGRRFQDVTTAGGFGHLQKGHGVAFGDLDADGDQDIYAVIGGALDGDVGFNVLFENPGVDHQWITLRLVGTTSNRDAIGARIKVVVSVDGGRREIHRVVSTGGTFGSSSLQQEIGLGDARSIEAIEISWPATGERQVVEGAPLDRVVRIVEGRPGYEIVPQKRIRWPTGEAAVEPHRHHHSG